MPPDMPAFEEDHEEEAPAQPEFRVVFAGRRHGRDVTRGYVDALPVLSPHDPVLSARAGSAWGPWAYDLYRELLRDAKVRSALDQRRRAVLAREWVVEPGGKEARDEEAAEMIEATLRHIRWNTVCEKMHYGVWYGYAAGECVWKPDGNRIVLDKVLVRDPRRFAFGSPDGELRLLTTSDYNGEPVPPRKFWHFSVGAENDDEPYGWGLASFVYWPAFFRRHVTRSWLRHTDKYASPTAVGTHRRSAPQKEIDDLVEAGQAVHSEASIAIPEGTTLNFLEAMRAGGASFHELYQEMGTEITQIILTETMTVEDGSSKSQSETHKIVRDEVVDADSDLLDDTFSRSVVRWLVDWNLPGAAYPTVERASPAKKRKRIQAQKELAERDNAIVALGYRPTQKYVEDTYDVPVEPMPMAAMTPTPPASGREPQPGSPAADLAEGDEDDPSPVSTLAERLRGEAGPLIDGWTETLNSSLGSAGSLKDWGDSLNGRAAELDVEPLAEVLQRAFAALELAGRFDIDQADSVADLAEPSFEHVALAFTEQIEFFRGKLNLTTLAWTDIWQEAHDRAFVVAGAARDDLVEDLRAAVDTAIADGTHDRDLPGAVRRDRRQARLGVQRRAGLADAGDLPDEPADLVRRRALRADAGRQGDSAVLALPALGSEREPAAGASGLGRPGASGRRSVVEHALPAERLGLQLLRRDAERARPAAAGEVGAGHGAGGADGDRHGRRPRPDSAHRPGSRGHRSRVRLRSR